MYARMKNSAVVGKVYNGINLIEKLSSSEIFEIELSGTDYCKVGTYYVGIDALDIFEHKPVTEPKIGDRVMRGPDWKWGNQDNNGYGTVTGVGSPHGWVKVKWHNDSSNKYKYRYKEALDLFYAPQEKTESEDIQHCFPKGSYIVLLADCKGVNGWSDSLPIDHVYRLSKDSYNDTRGFDVEIDLKGYPDNGWSCSSEYPECKLKMRAATVEEIDRYNLLNRPYPISDLLEITAEEETQQTADLEGTAIIKDDYEKSFDINDVKYITSAKKETLDISVENIKDLSEIGLIISDNKFLF